MEMRWFTDAAYADLDNWDAVVGAYSRHLETLIPSLPVQLADLATARRLNLHDAELREVEVDVPAHRVTIVARTGDLEVGYRDVTLRFSEASIEPYNLQALAYAVGARYHTDHWGDTITVVLAQEIDRDEDGRWVLRLRLWPFYSFAVLFGQIELTEVLSDPRTREPGTFRAVPEGSAGETN